jgi:hypothetical protein
VFRPDQKFSRRFFEGCGWFSLRKLTAPLLTRLTNVCGFS